MTRSLLPLLALLFLATPVYAKAPTSSEVESMLFRAEGDARARLDEARARTAAEEEALSTAKAQLDGARQAAAAAAARVGSAKGDVKAATSEMKAAQRVGDVAGERALAIQLDRNERVLDWRIARKKETQQRVKFQTALLAQKKADLVFAQRAQEHTELEVYADLMGDSGDAAVAVGKAMGKMGSAQRNAGTKEQATLKARMDWEFAAEAAAALRPDDTTEALLAARESELSDLRGELAAAQSAASSAAAEAALVTQQRDETSARAAEADERTQASRTELETALATARTAQERADELEVQLAAAEQAVGEAQRQAESRPAPGELQAALDARTASEVRALRAEEERILLLRRVSLLEEELARPRTSLPPVTVSRSATDEQLAAARAEAAESRALAAAEVARREEAEAVAATLQRSLDVARADAIRRAAVDRAGEAQADNHQEELAALRTALDEAEQARGYAQTTLAEVQERLIIEREERGRELDALDAAQGANQALQQRRIDGLAEELAAAKQARQELALQNQELQAARGEQAERLASLAASLEEARREAAQTRADAAQALEQQRSELEADEQAIVAGLEVRLAAAEKARAEGVAKAAALDARLADAELRQQETQQALDTEKAARDADRAAHSTKLDEDARRAEAAAVVAEKALTQERTEKESVATKLKQAQTELAAGRDALADASRRADALSQDLEDLRAKYAAELALAGARGDKLDDAVTEQRTAIEELSVQLAQARTEIGDKAAELAVFDRSLRQAEAARAAAEKAAQQSTADAAERDRLHTMALTSLESDRDSLASAADELRASLATEREHGSELSRRLQDCHSARRDERAQLTAEVSLLEERLQELDLTTSAARDACAERERRLLDAESLRKR